MDFAQAMRNFFNGTDRRPRWRRARVHEGFRQVALKQHPPFQNVGANSSAGSRHASVGVDLRLDDASQGGVS
jgi:hypothetical protein